MLRNSTASFLRVLNHLQGSSLKTFPLGKVASCMSLCRTPLHTSPALSSLLWLHCLHLTSAQAPEHILSKSALPIQSLGTHTRVYRHTEQARNCHRCQHGLSSSPYEGWPKITSPSCRLLPWADAGARAAHQARVVAQRTRTSNQLTGS